MISKSPTRTKEASKKRVRERFSPSNSMILFVKPSPTNKETVEEEEEEHEEAQENGETEWQPE